MAFARNLLPSVAADPNCHVDSGLAVGLGLGFDLRTGARRHAVRPPGNC